MKRAKENIQSIVPSAGERALIVGATGSGKTGFACFLLERLETVPILIYDTKEEEKFAALPASITVTDLEGVANAMQNETIDYVIFRPSIHVSNSPDDLDELLLYHYNYFHNSVAYIDEVYQFHKAGRPGPGLMGLLTRGRSRGITTIISTQRPSYLSRFCISESQNFYIFKLIDMNDKKRIGDFVPDFVAMREPEKFGFWYYKVGDDAPKLYPKIKLADTIDTGYINLVKEELPILELSPKKAIWI